MVFEEIIGHINTNLGKELLIGTDESCIPKAVIIHPENLLELMEFLHTNEQLYFDSLSCITGLDNGVDKNTMEMIYNLYSIPYNHHLTVKVTLDRAQPVVDSLTSIWKTADWHERETYDLLGIDFTNHPDLRRILLPVDWEGYPLRKDYKQQEYYRGIKVEY